MESYTIAMEKHRTGLAVLLSAILLSHCPVRAQTAKNLEEPTGKDFVEHLSRTSDVLFYGDTRCLMDRSPLSVFDNYLLGANPDEPQWHVQNVFPGSGPVYYEKEYSATWKITGDTLYLVDLNPVFVSSDNNSDSVKRALFDEIREATGLVFENDGKPRPATWFGGRLGIKQTRTASESYSEWIDSPFYEIMVEKGRITASRKIGIQTPSPASDWLKKRMKDDTLPARFKESLSASDQIYIGTSDALSIEGVLHCIDRTPLDCFEGYADLFSDLDSPGDMEVLGHMKNIPGPVKSRDKNYEAIWKIVNDTLYLSDIQFSVLTEAPFLKFPHDEQYKTIENLTGIPFRFDVELSKIAPVSPSGVLPARWFSGTILVVKNPWNGMKSGNGQAGTTKVLRLTFEKGKLVRTENP